MRWISDRFDFLSATVFSVGIFGIAALIKSIVDLFRGFMAKSYLATESVITRGDIFTVIVVIVGVLFIIYKMYTSPENMTQEEDNRRQLFYKMIILLMLLGAMLSYSKPVFLVVLFKVKSIELFMFGFVVFMTYRVVKKKLYN
ncbi:hypothetical protein HLB30_06520 [Peptostreptococcus russellii]|uniref:Uncharacterized protein n=1 Tax=Peptostreptococcus russellii TaxID=215200 RepID=A0A1H8G475_9FIRM|nr:hypothetical protein [Peptostreptococcus russellii]MBC2578175.1 hypothetical protein [Peptostreptococcus russellii]SEN38803.1 hypothetical protein SAMN05216454_10357 [Peptostreptococcus russellii]